MTVTSSIRAISATWRARPNCPTFKGRHQYRALPDPLRFAQRRSTVPRFRRRQNRRLPLDAQHDVDAFQAAVKAGNCCPTEPGSAFTALDKLRAELTPEA